MRHDQDAVGEHSQHPLPFLLLELYIIKLLKSIPKVDLIHPDEAGRYDNDRGDMDEEVVVDVVDAVVVEHYYNIGIETNTVNSHHLIPLEL